MELSTWLAGSDALTELDAAHRAAWTEVDGELLEVCRDRMAMLLGHGPTLHGLDPERAAALRSWPTDASLDERTRTALDVTEQYVVDVAALTDEQVAALRAHLGDQGLVDFLNALLVVEQRMTLELGLAAAIGDGAAA